MMRRFAIIAVAIIALGVGNTAAQKSPPATHRRIESRVAPVYPDLAKRMNIRGIVKIEAVVKPNGTVRSTRTLGGNPVLVDAALEAVWKWKFESSQNETTEVVQVIFDGQ
jgi:TonB family protein